MIVGKYRVVDLAGLKDLHVHVKRQQEVTVKDSTFAVASQIKAMGQRKWLCPFWQGND